MTMKSPVSTNTIAPNYLSYQYTEINQIQHGQKLAKAVVWLDLELLFLLLPKVLGSFFSLCRYLICRIERPACKNL